MGSELCRFNDVNWISHRRHQNLRFKIFIIVTNFAKSFRRKRYQVTFLLQQEYGFSDKNILKKIAKKMRSINPCIIARNHIVQEVIDSGNNLDFKSLENFLKVLKNPFDYDEKNIFYHTSPSTIQRVLQTFCGT